MLTKLNPDAYTLSVFALKPDYFLGKGIKGIIFDLDNTITPWRSAKLEARTVSLINSYIASGLKICVVSNARNKRAARLLAPLGIPWIARARKPSRRAFFKALEILDTDVCETAIVGDQVFTDIYGGKRMGLHTVLVKPMSEKEFIGTKFARFFEKRLLTRLHKKGYLREPI